MSEMNRIDHYLSTDGIRITVADVTDAARRAQEIHHLPSLSAVILGKVLNAAAILAMDFKNHEGVSLKWVTNSPLGTIHADAYEGRYVRGFIENPDDGTIPYTPAEEAKWVSRRGKLFVTRYSLLKMPYVSAVDLSDGDTASCVSDYINSSDQTLSHVEIEALTDKKGKLSAWPALSPSSCRKGIKNFLESFLQKTGSGIFLMRLEKKRPYPPFSTKKIMSFWEALLFPSAAPAEKIGSSILCRVFPWLNSRASWTMTI